VTKNAEHITFLHIWNHLWIMKHHIPKIKYQIYTQKLRPGPSALALENLRPGPSRGQAMILAQLGLARGLRPGHAHHYL
jgi:hypothetical protein